MRSPSGFSGRQYGNQDFLRSQTLTRGSFLSPQWWDVKPWRDWRLYLPPSSEEASPATMESVEAMWGAVVRYSCSSLPGKHQWRPRKEPEFPVLAEPQPWVSTKANEVRNLDFYISPQEWDSVLLYPVKEVSGSQTKQRFKQQPESHNNTPDVQVSFESYSAYQKLRCKCKCKKTIVERPETKEMYFLIKIVKQPWFFLLNVSVSD